MTEQRLSDVVRGRVDPTQTEMDELTMLLFAEDEAFDNHPAPAARVLPGREVA